MKRPKDEVTATPAAPEVVDVTEQLEAHDREMKREGRAHPPWCPVARRDRTAAAVANPASTGATSNEYRTGYDQIDWTKRGPSS